MEDDYRAPRKQRLGQSQWVRHGQTSCAKTVRTAISALKKAR